MTTRRRRLRVTLGSLMALIAALSLLILVSLPLVRLGPPPCLGPFPTARWLVASPGTARCADCHARAGVDPTIAPGHLASRRARPVKAGPSSPDRTWPDSASTGQAPSARDRM